MSLPETVVLDVPNLFAAASVFIAILGAIYAARSAAEAKKQAQSAEAAVQEARAQSATARGALGEAKTQNQIALHQHRLDTYKAFLKFRGLLSRSGVQFRHEATWELWDYAQMSEFYFRPETAKALVGVIDASLAIISSRAEWDKDSTAQGEERVALVKKSHAQFAALRDVMVKLEEDIRTELRLVNNAA